MFFKIGTGLFYAGITVVLVALVMGCANGTTLLAGGVKCFPFKFLHLGLFALAGLCLWAIGFLVRLWVCLCELARTLE